MKLNTYIAVHLTSKQGLFVARRANVGREDDRGDEAYRRFFANLTRQMIDGLHRLYKDVRMQRCKILQVK